MKREKTTTAATSRIYTCCPEAGCTAYRDSLGFLRGFGIEPAIRFDEDCGAHYFEFTLPPSWSLRKRRRFNAAVAEQVRTGNKPCDNCGNVMYSGGWWAECNGCQRRCFFCEECDLAQIDNCGCQRH